MRILVLNWKDRHHPAAGGAEVYTHEVAARLVRRGHDVTLFCAAVPGRPPVEVDEGITVVRAGSRLGVYAAARRFWARHPHRWDVVVDEVNTRPFLTPRWVRGTPVVALIHQVAAEVWDAELPRPVAILGRRVLEPRWLAAYATTPTMTVSASSAASLRTYGLGDLRLVPEGLSLPQGLPSARKEATLTLCCIGRLSASKRVDHALAAFAPNVPGLSGPHQPARRSWGGSMRRRSSAAWPAPTPC
jgi:glycosyltransferase involved in cell wall biosynthesis